MWEKLSKIRSEMRSKNEEMEWKISKINTIY